MLLRYPLSMAPPDPGGREAADNITTTTIIIIVPPLSALELIAGRNRSASLPTRKPGRRVGLAPGQGGASNGLCAKVWAEHAEPTSAETVARSRGETVTRTARSDGHLDCVADTFLWLASGALLAHFQARP